MVYPPPPDTGEKFPEIVYEDNHILGVCKPAGVLTQGDRSNIPSLLELLKAHIKQRDEKPGNVYLGLIQRLDKPVSGIIILAKTSKAAARLALQIRNRQVGKFYVARTDNKLAAGGFGDDWRDIIHHLVRTHDKTIVSEHPARDAQKAVLQMKTILRAGHSCFYLISLITGRKHQIRAQLSALGSPIHGDTKYGSHTPYSCRDGIGLHALCCVFQHPVRQKSVGVTAPLPDALIAGLTVRETSELKQRLTANLDELTAKVSGMSNLVV